jgi:D-threo-aldose 1-dehydrogenase
MDSAALALDVTSTRIGFGCAGLMREPSARKRRRLLDEAFDQGIIHFDVARMYGLGATEGELGRFARGRRDSIVIATKFGIEAASGAGRFARLQGPARRLLARYPAVRSYIKGRSDAFRQSHRYDVATARASLNTSLRELGTDYVDLLFLHDPSPTDRVDLPEICGYLEEARQAGQIRAWGLAGERDPCLQMRELLPPAAVLQVRDDILSRASPQLPEMGPVITFGVLANSLHRMLAYLDRHPERRCRWSEIVGIDCSSPEALATLLLRDALHANPRGVVLFNTTRPERLYGLNALVAASRDEHASTLLAFRDIVNDEISRID